MGMPQCCKLQQGHSAAFHVHQASAQEPVHPANLCPFVQCIQTDTFGCYDLNSCCSGSDKCQRRYSNDTTGSCRGVSHLIARVGEWIQSSCGPVGGRVD